MMAALAALPVTSSYSSSAHDQHGVGVFAEFHQVGHPADDVAVGGLAEGGLVDRAVGDDEAVIGPVEFAAGVVAVRLGPALVLRLQDAAGAVAQARPGRPAACRSACRRP